MKSSASEYLKLGASLASSSFLQRIAIRVTMNSKDKDEPTYRLDDMSKQQKSTGNIATHLAFGVFGFVIYATFSVIVSAVQDALQGTLIPSPVVIIIIFSIVVLCALILPYVVEKIPQLVLMSAEVVFMILGIVLYVVVDRVFVRLTGVFLASLGQTLAEVGNLSKSALYGDDAMAWFSFGTGLGYLIGPLYFTG